MFGVRKPPTGCNFVHNDEIWYFMIFMYYKARSVLIRCVVSHTYVCRKDHVRRELQMSRKWPNSWGFLAVHYRVRQYYIQYVV